MIIDVIPVLHSVVLYGVVIGVAVDTKLVSSSPNSFFTLNLVTTHNIRHTHEIDK